METIPDSLVSGAIKHPGLRCAIRLGCIGLHDQ